MKPTVSSIKLSRDELHSFLQQLLETPMQGFYRLSDETEEHYLDDQTLPATLLNDLDDPARNAFLLEAEFYQNSRSSISLRQVNDRWLCTTVAWPQEPQRQDDATITELLTRTPRVLLCYTHYEPVSQSGFDVLTPVWTAFVGFRDNQHKG